MIVNEIIAVLIEVEFINLRLSRFVIVILHIHLKSFK